MKVEIRSCLFSEFQQVAFPVSYPRLIVIVTCFCADKTHALQLGPEDTAYDVKAQIAAIQGLLCCTEVQCVKHLQTPSFLRRHLTNSPHVIRLINKRRHSWMTSNSRIIHLGVCGGMSQARQGGRIRQSKCYSPNAQA